MSDVNDVGVNPQEEEIEVEVADEELEAGASPTDLLDDETKGDIVNYLTQEIKNLYDGDDRKNFMDDVMTWRRQREARPKERIKDWPWPDASNVSIPMAMQETNAIYSMMKQNFAARKPMWAVEAYSGTTQEKNDAKVLAGFLNLFSEGKMYTNLREENNKIFYDLISLGTQFVKTGWAHEEKRFKKEDSSGNLVDAIKTVKDAPSVKGLRLEDFYTRLEWDDIQRAPWIAERLYLFDYELRERELRGVYENTDIVIANSLGEIDFDDNKEDELKRMGAKVPNIEGKLIPFYEVYLYWDIDGDGYDEDIVLWFDPTTSTILRVQYNTLGERPYRRFVYIERPNELYGIGVGWIVSALQDEMDALHNMRNDGIMISMLQMFATKRGSGIGPNEKFFPLKNIPVDDPKSDFVPIKFPDISYTTLQAELMTKEYADRATGASDAMMGFESNTAGTRQTASGTMFLASQGSKIFTAIMQSTIEVYNSLGELLIYHMIENKEALMRYASLLPEEIATLVPQVVQKLEIESIPTLFNFKIQTTDIEKSEDARKQSILTMMQLYQMYSDKILSLYPLVYSQQQQIPPEMKEAGTRLIMGNTKLMEKVFDFFGETESEDYLPYVKDIELMVEAIDSMKDQKISKIRQTQEEGANGVDSRTNPGGSGSPMGAAQQPPMASGGQVNAGIGR